jgi:hypothetical protein
MGVNSCSRQLCQLSPITAKQFSCEMKTGNNSINYSYMFIFNILVHNTDIQFIFLTYQQKITRYIYSGVKSAAFHEERACHAMNSCSETQRYKYKINMI